MTKKILNLFEEEIRHANQLSVITGLLDLLALYLCVKWFGFKLFIVVLIWRIIDMVKLRFALDKLEKRTDNLALLLNDQMNKQKSSGIF